MTKANDTHGTNAEGSYAFDLDGTIAVYDTWQGIGHIGEPVKPMVDLIKKMHDEGKVVKILTARVAPRENPEHMPTPYPLYAGEDIGDVPEYAARWMCKMKESGHLNDQVEACRFYFKRQWNARDFVADWCLKNLGFLPEITHEKDPSIVEFYDDRAKQVIPNTGELVEDIARIQSGEIQKCERIFNSYERENLRLSRKLDCKFNGFFAGMMLGSLIALAIDLSLSYFLRLKTPQTEALDHLQSAIIEVQEAFKK